jgi:hypothetical protein
MDYITRPKPQRISYELFGQDFISKPLPTTTPLAVGAQGLYALAPAFFPKTAFNEIRYL